MPEAFRGLTTRGRSLLSASLAAAAAAFVLGEGDLLRVALLLAALPLLAVAYVKRSSLRLGCTRTIEPQRTPVGSSVRVVLRLENLSSRPTGALLLEDSVPVELGSHPKLVLEQLGASQATSVGYTLRCLHRGRYQVGALVAQVSDPFGLCSTDRSFADVLNLVVVPRVVALPAVSTIGSLAPDGTERSRALVAHGSDDSTTREYRHGDDLRRVHWRSTARTGELMVRREEQPRSKWATVILDTRMSAYEGAGPDSGFEWAVSAAASVSVHLLDAGYHVRLVLGDGPASTPAGRSAALDTLAQVELSETSTVSELVSHARRSPASLVVGVFGALAPDQFQALGALSSGAACVGFTLEHWAPTASTQSVPSPPSAPGWRMVAVQPGDDMSALWLAAALPSQAGPPAAAHQSADGVL